MLRYGLEFRLAQGSLRGFGISRMSILFPNCQPVMPQNNLGLQEIMGSFSLETSNRKDSRPVPYTTSVDECVVLARQ